MKESSRRIVVTGLGVVSPLGLTTTGLWNALIAGKSGIRPFEFDRAGDSPIAFAGKCSDFSGAIEDFGENDPTKKKTIKKATKLMSREIQMGVAATQRALADAGIVSGSYAPERMGVTFGCDLIYSTVEDLLDGVKSCLSEQGTSAVRFDFSRWAKEGMPKMSPLWQLKYLPNMPSSHIAIINDFRGPNNSIMLQEASIGGAIGEAVETIRAGKVELLVVGATGSRLHPIKLVQTLIQEQVSKHESASRPFDRNRGGMVLGEGAGALILESREHALKRGANIYAEVLGGNSVAWSERDVSVDCRETALVQAMRNVLQKGNCGPESIGHINAHGLGTICGDACEARAINRVFGERKTPVPTTTGKGHFGNLGAGSGAVELIAGILALHHDRLFPILNYETADPECPIRVVRSGENLPSGPSFLKLALSAQGQASALLVRKA